MNYKRYYSSRGNYLKEHSHYFSKKRTNEDLEFIINVLKLKKKDKILDLACGHGRHTIGLARRGFNVDGLDFSGYLLRLAKKEARRNNLKVDFYQQDIHGIRLKPKYEKIFLFFADFGLFDAEKVFRNVTKILRKNGLFLLDCDNVFRLVKHLTVHHHSPYVFDFMKMELREKNQKGQGIKYYTFPELVRLLSQFGFRVVSVFGSYKKEPLSIDSKRMIIIARKG